MDERDGTLDSRNSSVKKMNSSVRTSVMFNRMNSSKIGSGKYDTNSVMSGSKDHSVNSQNRRSTVNINKSVSLYNSENPNKNYYSTTNNNNEDINIIEDS